MIIQAILIFLLINGAMSVKNYTYTVECKSCKSSTCSGNVLCFVPNGGPYQGQ